MKTALRIVTFNTREQQACLYSELHNIIATMMIGIDIWIRQVLTLKLSDTQSSQCAVRSPMSLDREISVATIPLMAIVVCARLIERWLRAEILPTGRQVDRRKGFHTMAEQMRRFEKAKHVGRSSTDQLECRFERSLPRIQDLVPSTRANDSVVINGLNSQDVSSGWSCNL